MGLDPTLSGVLYTAGGGFVLAVAGAGMRTFKKHQTDARDAIQMREFFFDTPANPRTGMPGKEGWISKVDRRFDALERSTREILREVKPDGNGETNLRGAVDRTARKVADE